MRSLCVGATVGTAEVARCPVSFHQNVRYNPREFDPAVPYESQNVSVLIEFSMSPLDKGISVSKYVARNLEIVADSGVPYRLGPMGTCLEGEWDDVMAVVGQCYRRMAEDCDRITCSIKIDARKGTTGRIESKTKKVEKILGRKLDQ